MTPGPNKVRCFLAWELAEADIHRLGAQVRALQSRREDRSIRWIPQANWHATDLTIAAGATPHPSRFG